MLTLFWDNPNKISYDSTDIYRADSRDGEMVWIGSVEPYSEQFTDYNLPKMNHVYYYKIVFVDEHMDPSDSIVFPMGYFPTGTGPGPQDLLRGNWSLGYFGEVNVGYLPNFVEMAEVLNHSTVPTVLPSTWYKFIAQGNIIYVPNRFLRSGGDTNEAEIRLNVPGEDREDIIGELYKDGYSYSVRPPYVDSRRRNQWVGFENADLSNSEYVKDSELGAIVTMTGNPLIDIFGGVRKLLDDPSFDDFPFPLLTSTPGKLQPLVDGRLTVPWVVSGARLGMYPPTQTLPAAVSCLHILELLFD